MKIILRNNNGRCLIRFKCPLYGVTVSKTMGSYWDDDDRHDMNTLIRNIRRAIKAKTWTGSIDDYLDGIVAIKRKPLIDCCLAKSKVELGGVYLTLYNKLFNKPQIESPHQLKSFLEGMNVSGSTFNRYRTAIQSVRPDLTEGLSRKRNNSTTPEPFSLEEQASLCSNFANEYQAHLVQFWLACGFRNGELGALTLDDFVKVDGNYFISISKTISKGVVKHEPKNGKSRLVPLTEKDWGYYRQPYQANPSCYRRSSWNSWIASDWKPLLERAGLQYRRPYCLRHTAISNYISKTKDIEAAARIFGTSILMIQKHYLGQIKADEAV